MLQSFAHRVFVVMGAFLLLSLMSWLAYSAVDAGIFGEEVRQWMARLRGDVQRLRIEYKDQIDIGLQISGAVATLVMGAWTIHKSLYFANKQLPQRLAEYLDQREDRLMRMLPLRLADLRHGQQIKRGDFVLLYGPLQRALAKESLPPPRQFKNDIQRVIGDLERRADIAARTAELIRTERLSAHVLHGAAILADIALLNKDRVAERQRMIGEALSQFEEALKLDENNLDALELSAELRRSIGDEDSRFLERLLKAAGHSGDIVRTAKANRMVAEHFAEHSVLARVIEARGYVEAAIGCLADQTDQVPRMKLERADLYALAARIYRRLGRYGLMRNSVDQAMILYEQLGEYKRIGDLKAATKLDPSDREEPPQVEG